MDGERLEKLVLKRLAKKRLQKMRVGQTEESDKGSLKVKRVIVHKDYEIYQCDAFDSDRDRLPDKYLNSKNNYIDDSLADAKEY